MQRSVNSRTATRIKNGRVQPKNRNRPTGHEGYVIDRQSPGRGCRHVVTKKDLLALIDLIPEWPRYSVRLERIVLAPRDESADGYHAFYHEEETGAIYLNAWPEDLWVTLVPIYFEAHKEILDKLGVTTTPSENGTTCHFTEAQARAFTLLHVFMHELGHHFDRIHQKHRLSQQRRRLCGGLCEQSFRSNLHRIHRGIRPSRPLACPIKKRCGDSLSGRSLLPSAARQTIPRSTSVLDNSVPRIRHATRISDRPF